MKNLYLLLTFSIPLFTGCTDQASSEKVSGNIPDSLAQVASASPHPAEKKSTLDGVYYMVVTSYGVDVHSFLVLEGEHVTYRSYTLGIAMEYSTEMVTSSEKEFKVCSPYDKRGCNDFYIKPDKLIANTGHAYQKVADDYTWKDLEKQYGIESTKVTKL